MKGNCYEANFNEFTKRVSGKPTYNEGNWVLVHAMREITSEWWGGHAFLLDKENNKVWDYSNGKVQSWDKDEIFKTWNIQEDGDRMYFEYNYVRALQMALDTGHYGSWELLFEDWKDEEWMTYMTNYFMPTFQPLQHQMRLEHDKKA